MSNASGSRGRWSLPTPKAPLQLAMDFMGRSDVWARIGLCLAATIFLFVLMSGWNAPFSYRVRQAPLRDMHAHTAFEVTDYRATSDRKERAKRNFLCYYENDPQALEQLRQALTDDLFEILQKDYVDVQESQVWTKFFLVPSDGSDAPTPDEESVSYTHLTLPTIYSV